MKTCLLSLVALTAGGFTFAQTNIFTFTLPGGNTILQASGAVSGSTSGGTATADTRTLYFYQPDFGDPQPNLFDYTGGSWPYVYVDTSISVGPGISAAFTTANDGVGDFLMIEGNPIYQFAGDSSATAANGNFGPWYFIEPDGTATQSTVAAIPETSTVGFLLGLVCLSGLIGSGRRRNG